MNAREARAEAERLEAVAELLPSMAQDADHMLSLIGLCSAFAKRASQDARVTSCLENIAKGADRIDRVVRLMRELSADPSGLPADPHLLLDAVREDLLRIAGAEVDIVIREGCPCVVAGAGLEQILVDLCSHARDELPKGGPIHVELGPVAPDDADLPEGPPSHETYARVSVSWSHPDASETGDRSEDQRHLTRARRLARALRGAIEVRSDPRGTMVRALLPAVQSDEAPLEDEDLPQGRGERVIVVDGIAEVRALTVQLLGENGYDVVDGVSADNVLAVLGGTNAACDLLVTEVYMGLGLTGPQLADRVRAVRPGVKVLYVSGYHPPNVSVEDTPVVSKPFTRADLLEGARRALDAQPIE